MRLAIIGSRSFDDYALMAKELNSIHKIELIVSGGARGADSLAEKYAREKKIPTTIFKPDWNKYGRAAGMIRNKLIIESSDAVIAFWDGISPGTANSIQRARDAKKHVKIVYF